MNSVNATMLSLEWVLAVTALTAGGFAEADTLLNDEPDRALEPYAELYEQQIGAAVFLAAGSIVTVVAIVQSLAARDEKLSSRSSERQKDGSLKNESCGQDFPSGKSIALQSRGSVAAIEVGQSGADGRLSLAWLELPPALFEMHDQTDEIDVLFDGKVVSTTTLEAAWLAHAQAAWSQVPANDSEQVALFHKRFPGANALLAGAGKSEEEQDPAAKLANAAETKQRLEALTEALAAGDAEAARITVDALQGRLAAAEWTALGNQVQKLEDKVAALNRATVALAALGQTRATVADITSAKASLSAAANAGASADEMAAMNTRFNDSWKPVALRAIAETRKINPEEALTALLALRGQLDEALPALESAIKVHNEKLVRSGVGMARERTTRKEFAEALTGLDELQNVVGANKNIERQRDKTNKAKAAWEAALSKRESASRAAEERAAKREEEKLAKIEKARLASEARAAKIEERRLAKIEQRRLASEAAANRLNEREQARALAVEKAEAARQARVEAEASADEKQAAAREAQRIAEEERAAERLAKTQDLLRRKSEQAAARLAQRDAKLLAAAKKQAERNALLEAKKLAKSQELKKRQQAQEAKKLQKLQKLQKLDSKLAVAPSTTAVARSEAAVASYFEYQLDPSLASADALTRLLLPTGCKAAVSNVNAVPPNCPGCAVAAMRKVRLTCAKGTLDFLQLKSQVWARCTEADCGECSALAGGAVAGLRVGPVPAKVMRSCRLK